MRTMLTVRIHRALILAVMLTVGCGQNDSAKQRDKGAKPAPEENTGETEKAQKTSSGATAPKPAADSKDETGAGQGDWDAAAFCAAVYPMARVGELSSIPDLQMLDGAAKSKIKGLAECRYDRLDERKMPIAVVSLMADCREIGLNVARHRKTGQAVYGNDEAGQVYADIELGKGGYFGEMQMMKKPLRQVVFVHAELPCVVTATTTFADVPREKVEALGKLVHDSLNDANRPRK